MFLFCSRAPDMAALYRTPSLDAEFLSRWSPAKLAAIGIIAYVLMIITAPLEYDYSLITAGGTIYAVAVLIGFFGGCHFGRAMFWGSTLPSVQPVRFSPDLFINVAAIIGAIGVGARVYDRFVLRGFAMTDTFLERREIIAEQVTAFGYLGGIGFSFGLIALVLIWLSSSQRRRPLMFVFAASLACYPAGEALLQGSRSTLLHVVFLIFFFALSTKALTWIVRSPLALLVGGVVLAGVFELIYEIRTLEANDAMDIADVFKFTTIGQYAQPQPWVTDAIIASGGTGVVGGVLKTWTHLVQYLTHSWLVYFQNFEQFQDVPGWGRLHLYLPMRTLSAIVGENVSYDPVLYGMEPGVFSTVISYIQYDFGPAGPLVALLFGVSVTFVHNRAIRSPERWLPLYSYLALACATMLVDNQLVGSLGAFATWSVLAWVPLHSFLSMLSRGAGSNSHVNSQTTLAVHAAKETRV
jgi:hypothetical protein